MNTTKRFLAAALAIALCLSLAGCGDSGGMRGERNDPPEPSEESPELSTLADTLPEEPPEAPEPEQEPEPEPPKEEPVTYFTYDIGGMEFYIPSYYEEALSSSDENASYVAFTNYGLSILTIMAEQLYLNISQDEFEKNYKDIFFNSIINNIPNVILSTEDCLVGRLSGKILITKEEELDIFWFIAITFNAAENKSIRVAIMFPKPDDIDINIEKEIFLKMLTTATVVPSQPDQAAAPEPPVEPAPSPSGIRPEFKEAMDSYEAFFDEYIAFLKKYESASGMDALNMLTDYVDYLTRLSETMDAMDKLDDGELSKAEALYYLEVTTRIYAKLAEAGQ